MNKKKLKVIERVGPLIHFRRKKIEKNLQLYGTVASSNMALYQAPGNYSKKIHLHDYRYVI